MAINLAAVAKLVNSPKLITWSFVGSSPTRCTSRKKNNMYEEKSIDDYIRMGVISINGVDEDGELMFSISEKAKELAPELWEAHVEYVDELLVQLFEKDLIEISYDEDLNANISLSDQGKNILIEMGLMPE